VSDVTKENNRCRLGDVYNDPELNIRKGTDVSFKDIVLLRNKNI